MGGKKITTKKKPKKQIKKQPVKKTAGQTSDYSAKDIFVLEGLDPVRKRPGMYIGSTGIDGLHHLILEVVDNAIDEAMAGYADNVSITLLPSHQVRVVDDGRGIPVERHKQTKKSALETVMTTLHAGGKFGGDSYKISGGLHGVGVSVVNALSSHLRAEVCRDGYIWVQEYKRGVPTAKVKKTTKCTGSGTAITFIPDEKIFTGEDGTIPEYEWKRILNRMRQQAYLVRSIRINIYDKRESEKRLQKEYSFHFEGGIRSYVSYLNRDMDIKHKRIFYTGKEVEENNMNVEIALQYTDDLQAREMSFANNIYTAEGGMHLTGFRTALTRTLNDYARKNGLIKEADNNFTGDDVREGLTAVISVKLKEPQFEGQTKGKLGNPEARTVTESVFGETFAFFLEENPQDAKSIIDKVTLALRARKAAKAAKDSVLRKGALEGLTLPGKLADCQSRNAEESEIFIVEGDSAGGCFSGDTEVALADGRNSSFKDLVKEDQKGKKNFCYTIKDNGKIGIAPIKNPRITKRNADVVKVILDNNEKLVCTPDHKFMLRDGSFKEAQNLTKNDSLMPLRRQLSRVGKRITIDGYEMVFDTSENRWLFTHVLADNYNIENTIYFEKNGVHRHHKDFNKLNNNPNNLIRLSAETHLDLHRRTLEKGLHSPKSKEKARRVKRTLEYRKKISSIMKSPKMRAMLSERAKKQWEDPVYKEYMTNKFSVFYKNNEKYRLENNRRLKDAQKKYWSSEENRNKQASRVKKHFEQFPEKKQELSNQAKAQWQNSKLIAWRRQKTKEQWNDDFRAKRLKSYNKTYCNKFLKKARNIYDRVGTIEIESYEKLRKQTNDKTLLRLDTILERFFDNDFEKMKEAVKLYNHKVKSVVKINQRMDVYDLEVLLTHNFALASGVFVHNSAKQGRDRKFQAILPLRGKIMNVERARFDKMLSSKEVKALIIALGTAIADEFNISKLRYHRIIIATDADVDGAHIRTLLLTLFYRYFKEIIEGGYLYIAQPPLYKVQSGKTIEYAYDDADKNKVISAILKEKALRKKTKSSVKAEPVDEAEEETGEADEVPEDAGGDDRLKGIRIQRYKGLGEMNPSQLWETTMDPERRILKKVIIEDAEEANRTFDILMGKEVEPRKLFIQTHAKTVKNLDA